MVLDNQILSIIILLGVLFLILPNVLSKNLNSKIFKKNLIIWIVLISFLILIMYLIGII